MRVISYTKDLLCLENTPRQRVHCFRRAMRTFNFIGHSFWLPPLLMYYQLCYVSLATKIPRTKSVEVDYVNQTSLL